MKRIAIVVACIKRIAIVVACILLLLLTISIAFLSTVNFNDLQNPLNASRDGDMVEIQRLLANGSDPNTADKYGTAPLAEAANKVEVILAKLLLKAGANVE